MSATSACVDNCRCPPASGATCPTWRRATDAAASTSRTTCPTASTCLSWRSSQVRRGRGPRGRCTARRGVSQWRPIQATCLSPCATTPASTNIRLKASGFEVLTWAGVEYSACGTPSNSAVRRRRQNISSWDTETARTRASESAFLMSWTVSEKERCGTAVVPAAAAATFSAGRSTWQSTAMERWPSPTCTTTESCFSTTVCVASASWEGWRLTGQRGGLWRESAGSNSNCVLLRLVCLTANSKNQDSRCTNSRAVEFDGYTSLALVLDGSRILCVSVFSFTSFPYFFSFSFHVPFFSSQILCFYFPSSSWTNYL